MKVKTILRSPRWALKQKLASPSFYYGDGGTIHGTNYLDVEVSPEGEVVSVWFRCTMLPFEVTRVSKSRASTMSYVDGLPKITGVEIQYDK